MQSREGGSHVGVNALRRSSYLLPACVFDASGPELNPGRVVIVPLDVMRCPVVAQPVPVSIAAASAQFPQVQQYHGVRDCGRSV
jgi:hypothetical protein